MKTPLRIFAVLAALRGGGKEAGRPAGPGEAELSADLNAATIEPALGLVARGGGPRAERVAGMHAGVSALPGAAGAPVSLDGGVAQPAPAPPAAEPAQAGDVRWDDEPYGAIAAAARGELLPAPETGKDVPPLWRDPGGTWVAVGGRAEVLLVGIDELGDHGAPVRFTALTDPWLKGKVALAS